MTVLGIYSTPEAATEMAKAMIDGMLAPERVCNLRDIDRVRKELAKR